MNNIIKKIPFLMGCLAIFTAFCLMGLIFYWLLFPIGTSTPNVQPYEVLTPEVKQGGILQYKADYCRFTDIPAQTTRAFVNGLIYSMPMSVTQHKVGCYRDIISVTVPQELPIGTYRLTMVYIYDVSPIQKITKTAETETFRVITK